MFRVVNPIDAQKSAKWFFWLNDAIQHKSIKIINCTTQKTDNYFFLLFLEFLALLLLLFQTENWPNFSLSTDTDSELRIPEFDS